MSRILGPAHQLGIVVRDIEAAMRHWTEKNGVGPFFYMEDLPTIEFQYKGESHPLHIRAALAYSGPMQIELIELIGNTPSAYLDFLGDGHEGLHHIGYLSEDYDADLQRALDAGMVIEQSGVVLSEDGRFAYFESDGHPGTVMELIAVTDTNREIFQMIKAASENWDGTEPVRRMG